MAKVTVDGTVARTFYDGRGAEVVEEFTVKGELRKVRWACWFDAAHGLSEGQAVSVSGLHSDQVDEWEKDGQTRHSVKRSINKARVEGQQVVESAPAQDSWNVPSTGGEYDASPF